MNKREHKKTNILTYFLLILGSISMLLPFLWMISSSLKSKTEVFQFPPKWIPEEFHWENYPRAVASFPFLQYTFNTAFVTIAVVIGTVIIALLAGYAFARVRFRYRDQLFLVVLAMMMVPGQVTMIPIFKLVKTLGWINSYNALIIPSLCSPFAIFLMRQFFLTLPRDLEDAAMVDGSSTLRTIFSIFVPLAKPAVATVSVLTFMSIWNSFLWPLLLITDKNKQLLTVGLLQFQGMYSTNYHLLMAATFLSLIPVFLVYLFAQDYFIEGIAATGVKG